MQSRHNNNRSHQHPSRSHHNNSPIPMELDQAESYRRNHNQQKNNNKPKGICYNCGKSDHFTKNCYSKSKAKIVNIEDKQEESSQSYERIEFAHLEDNRERLLKFNGQVNSKLV